MYKQAINYFEKTIKLYNENENILIEKKENFFKNSVYNLAIIYRKLGNISLAEKIIKDNLII